MPKAALPPFGERRPDAKMARSLRDGAARRTALCSGWGAKTTPGIGPPAVPCAVRRGALTHVTVFTFTTTKPVAIRGPEVILIVSVGSIRIIRRCNDFIRGSSKYHVAEILQHVVPPAG